MNNKHDMFLLGGMDIDGEVDVLKAGKLDAKLVNGSVCDISFNGEILVSQIYFALRNENWETIPFEMSDVYAEKREDSFCIRFTSHHKFDQIDFNWDGEISGYSDSRIIFSFSGRANSKFLRNRIGFCVLHPMDAAGRECVVTHWDGTREQGVFPLCIAPHQPFFSIKSISHNVRPDTYLTVTFDGDEFEMEDQRNWTDASFKTYCTPLDKPFPVEVHPGDEVTQSVDIQLIGRMSDEFVPENNYSGCISFDEPAYKNIPSIGSCAVKALSDTMVKLVRRLQFEHIRFDLRCEEADFADRIEEMFVFSHKLDTKLLLCIHTTESFKTQLKTLSYAIENNPYKKRLAGICVFQNTKMVTPAECIKAAHDVLGSSGVPIGAGTDAFFTQLNRERPKEIISDFVVYSNNPQVHAFDNDSMIKTLDGQASNVQSARAFLPGKPIGVSPVTLKMRWNPDATSQDAVRPGTLPKQVDPRQMSLFGAVWTLGSIGAMISSEASLVTYYELTGWKGMMEDEAVCPLPELFPSLPGMVYPMYFVFAWLGDFKGGLAAVSKTSDGKSLAILLKKGDRRRLLISNQTQKELCVHASGIKGIGRIKLLCMDNIREAVLNPEKFLQGNSITEVNIGGKTGITLPAYSIACIDM